MTDADPLDSADIYAATAAATGGLLAGMDSAVEEAIGDLDLRVLVAEAAMTVISQHVSNLARQALSDALTPERIQLLQERTTGAVERSFEATGHDHPAAGDELVYGSVDEWLRRYWRFTYRRRVSSKGSGTGRWKGRLVEQRRSGAAARNTLARVGSCTSRPRPGHEHLVDQSRRATHDRPAGH